MAKVEIKLSVGQGGQNSSQDVLLVQMLLNKFIIGGFLGGNALLLDGLAGKKTKQAIKAFQAIFLGHNAPDGKVEPSKATLDALNGPITQPQKGDPHNLVVHSNADGTGGYMVLGFPKAFTATQRSIVVHEATHAVCDGWAKYMGNIQSEALAHLAQAVYYYNVTGHHFSFGYAPTADVLTTAVNVALRMKLDGNRTVSAAERSELYPRVMKLPSVPPGKVLAYDGW